MAYSKGKYSSKKSAKETRHPARSGKGGMMHSEKEMGKMHKKMMGR